MTDEYKLERSNEKLPEIPVKKQTVHRDRGRGVERGVGIRNPYELFCVAAAFGGKAISGFQKHLLRRGLQYDIFKRQVQ